MQKRRKISTISVDGDVAYITLTKNRLAIIDRDVVNLVSDYAWYAVSKGGKHYAARHGRVALGERRTIIYLHHVVLTPRPGLVVDHISGDSLDNRRSNLRECTALANGQNLSVSKRNKSGAVGVYWNGRKFSATITANKRYHFLGNHDTLEEAVAARRAGEAKHFAHGATTSR